MANNTGAVKSVLTRQSKMEVAEGKNMFPPSPLQRAEGAESLRHSCKSGSR